MTRTLLSLAIGAGAALLFAPKSGTDLREDIVNRTRGIKDSILEKGRELLGQVEGSVESSTSSTTHRGSSTTV